MYLLTGDKKEWIGYVLFYNDDRVDGYNRFAFTQFLHLLEEVSLLSNDSIQSDKLTELKNEIFTNGYSSNFISILNEAVDSVREISNNIDIEDIIAEYYYQLDKYLELFPKYLYLDIVIALPIEEDKVRKYSTKNETNLLIELGNATYLKFREGKIEDYELQSICNKFVVLDSMIYKNKRKIDELSQSKDIRCSCGMQLDESIKFCGNCGNKVEKLVQINNTICRICEEEIPNNSRFCPCCGNRR